VEDKPYVLGDFVWTAWDYIGEASIGWLGYPQNKNFFPWNLAYCGDIDVCGWKRPQSYYRDALWQKDKVAVFVKPPRPTFPEFNAKLEKWARWNWEDVVADWNWKGYEDSTMEVVVYSSAREVELFLNNRSLGRKPTGTFNKYRVTYAVPYRAGKLTAVGYSGKTPVAVSSITTAGRATKIDLSPDRSTITSKHDLSYVNVTVTDSKGYRDTRAEQLLSFSIQGPGRIVAVANANPKSIESFTANKRTTWQGRCQVIVQSTGKPGIIKLKATAAGLKAGTVNITVK